MGESWAKDSASLRDLVVVVVVVVYVCLCIGVCGGCVCVSLCISVYVCTCVCMSECVWFVCLCFVCVHASVCVWKCVCVCVCVCMHSSACVNVGWRPAFSAHSHLATVSETRPLLCKSTSWCWPSRESPVSVSYMCLLCPAFTRVLMIQTQDIGLNALLTVPTPQSM